MLGLYIQRKEYKTPFDLYANQGEAIQSKSLILSISMCEFSFNF